MKTSNKLLIGLFVFVVIGMVIANIMLKNTLKNGEVIKARIQTEEQSSTNSTDSSTVDINQ